MGGFPWWGLPILAFRMSAPSSLTHLRSRLTDLTLRDEHRLRRRLDGLRKLPPARRQAVLEEIAAEIAAAEERVARRRAALPAVSYPPELPVTQKKDDIAAAIRDHQVVIVAGETGSGKTTQLPKICLELGRGVRGLIGHTQPRRIAARTVAERIAAELAATAAEADGHPSPPSSAGGLAHPAVGWKVRFTDRVSEDTFVKLMTDGILLAEIQGDRLLRQYDTLIIDEAHERSLNIDFLLGYLKQLLPKRPDLKLIVTSATIDPERFSRHFGGAPVIEVSGRTYPVEVRYRPVADAEDRDQIQAICDAVDELVAEGPGDILVFLSGEREIRDTADALARQGLRDTEILPLYARLSAADQHRVFQPHRGRRIVLATNVAETSLTVPGIKYVIDPGTARISRYSHRLKVQRLPIEPISQASANQRKGRCGRTSDGICIRLYSEEDFHSRPEFTDPEILRTNLAAVILAMTAAGLGDVATFPFIDPPDSRNIKAGIQLLEELGALEPTSGDLRRRLTPLGRKLAQIPLDPRLGRMVLEADRNGCAREVLIIAAALSIQDPRERPVDKEQAAAEKHARFADPDSDFLTYLNLWNYLQAKQKELSSNQFRKLCRAEFLNYLRVREWQDIEAQLRQVARSIGVRLNSVPADPERIHMSLLAGLLSHIGHKDERRNDQAGRGRRQQEYVGARGARFAIWPGSALAKKQPAWVMAAELVETSRLWGRVVAKIEPAWAESLGGHLLKRSYSEPHWSAKQAAVLAYEKVTLYGVPLVARRLVNYGRIDPELSRELFIRHALVEGDWETHHEFFHRNRQLLAEVEELEHRARRRDIVVDDETLFAFYDERIPPEVVSGAHFDSWWKKARRTDPDLLTFTPSMLVNESAGDVDESDYPDHWVLDGVRLRLSYQFEPGTDADGVTVHVPLAVLNQLRPDPFEWQVPGLREELVTALIRALPKQIRRHFVPAPDYARAVLERVSPGTEPLLPALERELRQLTGVSVPREAWQLERLPAHLRVTFRVVDEKGRTLAEGKDLAALRQRLKGKLARTLSRAAGGLEQEGLRTFPPGGLPRTFTRRRGPHLVQGYPALADAGDSVAVRVFETEVEQEASMWQGTRRLLLLHLPSPAKYVLERQSHQAKLVLSRSPHGSASALFDDCLACAVDKLMADAGGPAWDEEGFGKLLDAVRADLADTLLDTVNKVADILAVAQDIERRLGGTSNPVLLPALTDVKEQLTELVYPGFVTATGWEKLADLSRYLRAIQRRLDKLPQDPYRDRERMLKVQQMRQLYEEVRRRLPPERRSSPELRRIRWMIEELRVSYFAQVLGTPTPVSDKRIRKALEELAA